MIRETYVVSPTKSFDVEIAPGPADGKRYPMVVLIHGALGLVDTFGEQLRNFTEEIAAIGYVAALPTYYPAGESNLNDTNIAAHVPALVAAIRHLSHRLDVDANHLGLVGFSLGGGIAASYINSLPKGSVEVFVDFYGYVQPVLDAGVAKFPPTIIFHNKWDRIVPPDRNSERLAEALAKMGIDHHPAHRYDWYDERWEPGLDHAFKPGGKADVDSRARAKTWLTRHMPPVGRP